MCTVLLPPLGYPNAVNKYIIYQIIVHHQEVTSVHAAYGVLPCIYGMSSH